MSHVNAGTRLDVGVMRRSASMSFRDVSEEKIKGEEDSIIQN